MSAAVVTTPNIRTINLVKNNVIYCSSVFGGKRFFINHNNYPHGQFLLLPGTGITPTRSLIVYSIKGDHGEELLSGMGKPADFRKLLSGDKKHEEEAQLARQKEMGGKTCQEYYFFKAINVQEFITTVDIGPHSLKNGKRKNKNTITF